MLSEGVGETLPEGVMLSEGVDVDVAVSQISFSTFSLRKHSVLSQGVSITV